MAERIRLGVNIDHVATIRNARGGSHPDPMRAALMATEAGADGITLHLREDRRHIRDGDLTEIRTATQLPINMEMAATEEMLEIALKFKPETAMFVPEERAELPPMRWVCRSPNSIPGAMSSWCRPVRRSWPSWSWTGSAIAPKRPIALASSHRPGTD